MSGHSKWATTHRQKETADQKRAAIFTRLSHAIILAAKQGGGDPAANFKLRLAIDKARGSSMPKDNIERAVKRGTGELAGETIEEITYEAIGPENVGLIIKTLTDNKNRTISNLKNLLNKNNGKLASQNSVAWMFEQKAVIKISNIKYQISNIDDFEMELIDAGADDFKEDGDDLIIYAPLASFEKVKEFIESKNLKIDFAEVEYVAKRENQIEPQNPEAIEKLLAAIEEDDDVEKVFTNLK